MSIITELTATNAVAMAVATALEQAMGGDVILGVGRPKTATPAAEHLPSGNVRVAQLESLTGYAGGFYLVVAESLGVQLERLAPDEAMLTALAPVISAATTSLANSAAADMTFDSPEEITVGDLAANAPADHEFVIYSMIEGSERIAAFIIEIGAEISLDGSAPSAAPTGTSVAQHAPAASASASRTQGRVPATPDNVTRHEFEQLNDAMINLVEPRSLALLHDVEMGVTAELGRKRMTVRDLLALTPGVVIELDRAAGSPVDVLVNGTLIARGEVVVIDEEFGIRIAEIVAGAEAVA